MSTAALLYADHLATLQARTATALERGGFEHLVVPSGTLHYQVFDDRDYPYAANPQFKHWLPLTRNPGSWIVATPGAKPNRSEGRTNSSSPISCRRPKQQDLSGKTTI